MKHFAALCLVVLVGHALGGVDVEVNKPSGNFRSVRFQENLSQNRVVTISNVEPRRDTNGKILDAHDSKVNFQDGVYYWHASSYGLCKEPDGDNGCAISNVGACGFNTNHNVTLYTSTDLVTWENKGVVFGAENQLPPNSVLFAPRTVFNPNTNLWVMWFNYIVNDFGHSYYGVATSERPEGPFSLQVSQVKSLVYEDGGDENLFVDDDGTAYIIYTSISKGHVMTIERLSKDYLESEGRQPGGSSGIFGDSFTEAAMMFKRNGIYYTVFGSCCCYCGSGSPVNVYTSDHPLGPYTKRTSLGELHSQSTEIFQYIDGNGDTQFMYIGDHWQSAPDRIKGHDFTVWAPLKFSDDGLSVTTDGFQESFTISVQ